MTINVGNLAPSTFLQSAPNFRSWQRDTLERGILPVIGIAGGRGKSTVVRMLDAIFQVAHLRTATWTDLGIDIRGKRQRGEISAWSLALSRLAEGTVDVAIQELHWSTINAIGLPPSSYPVVAITNMAGSVDAPPLAESDTAWRGAMRASAAVHGDGMLVIHVDNYTLMQATRDATCTSLVTALSIDAPGLKRHLESGGSGAWIEDKTIVLGDSEKHEQLVATTSIPCGLNGAASFEVSSAIIASTVAASVGIDQETIASALTQFRASDDLLPGSFNVFEVDGYRAVVDVASPSWHLKSLLRAINPGGRRRQITVLGDVSKHPEHDLQEAGRVLGRYPGAIILHSNTNPDLIDVMRKGIASNDYPPLVVYLPTERRAINRAIKTARPDDVVLFLTDDDPGPATRAIRRQRDLQTPE
jgi:cyanophycin synthetase